MKSFDEWFEEKYLSLSIHANAGFEKDLEVKNIAKSAFTAGQQSKKAEVDELQKRIDEAMKMLAHGEGYGYEQCTRLAINILKGDSHESR